MGGSTRKDRGKSPVQKRVGGRSSTTVRGRTQFQTIRLIVKPDAEPQYFLGSPPSSDQAPRAKYNRPQSLTGIAKSAVAKWNVAKSNVAEQQPPRQPTVFTGDDFSEWEIPFETTAIASRPLRDRWPWSPAGPVFRDLLPCR